MKNKALTAVYSGGILQGIALVAFPAAATIFTNPDGYNLSSTAYGSLFIPQTILSIIASATSPKLASRYSAKTVFLWGLGCNAFSMLLLALSATVMHDATLSYCILLFATASLGLGFGLSVPTFNTMAARLYPERVDSVILTLNALLGVGTALAPAFIALFTSFSIWWGLPAALTLLFTMLIAYSTSLELPNEQTATSLSRTIPKLFWLFAAFAFIYGSTETLNGNWATIYMKEYQQASLASQSLALTMFWTMVTLGRVFFAWTARFFKEERAYQFLPFVLMCAFLLVGKLPSGNDTLSIGAFALAGFGCSALLPLTISLATSQLKSMQGAVSGGIIAFYLLGYGFAAFGTGPLEDIANIPLRQLYLFGTLLGLALAILASIILYNLKPSDTSQKP